MQIPTAAVVAFLAATASALVQPYWTNGTAMNGGSNTNATYITQTVTAFMTYCPSSTTFQYGYKVYTATALGWVTITACPGMCTISNVAGAKPTVLPAGFVPGYNNTTHPTCVSGATNGTCTGATAVPGANGTSSSASQSSNTGSTGSGNTGSIETTGSGNIETTGSGSIETTGSGSIETTGSGSTESAGSNGNTDSFTGNTDSSAGTTSSAGSADDAGFSSPALFQGAASKVGASFSAFAVGVALIACAL